MSYNELLILLSWAAHLSGYTIPETLPTVSYEAHAFFVEHVCGGRECRAVGWYSGGDVIYVDERYKGDDSDFARSLIVHELVHYLQGRSGAFDPLSCEDSREREREAYQVQNRWLVESAASFALIKPAPTSCRYEGMK